MNISRFLYFNNRKQFKKVLGFATKDNLLSLNNSLFSQQDGVAMGSPLGPMLANIFMCHYEEKWLSDRPSEYKPVLYRRCVDDTFLLFQDELHIQQFLDYLNSQHRNINFTCEIEVGC